MIPKVSKGWGIYGLVNYLMGPGRFNEHVDQHVFASWDGAPETHQPPPKGDGWFDVRELADLLAQPAVVAGVEQARPPAPRKGRTKPPVGPIWHCSLRNHARDRVLSDEEWSEVVADLMDRTGIAPRGDLGACRWVAIRHADDHVHVAAVLVRQDNGRRVYPRNDWARSREVCNDAERRLGITETPGMDRSSAAPATRAELEKATRRGENEPARQWLRRQVHIAAVQAQDPETFFQRLADLGVLVRPRELPPGQLAGYSVAAPDDVTKAGRPVWYSGRRLAPDLSLPKLLQRWASASPRKQPIPPAAGERSRVGRAERDAALSDAVTAITDATDAVAGGDPAVADAVAHAAGDMVVAAAWVTQRDRRLQGDLWPAAELFDRASRAPGAGQPLRWPPVAAELRRAAWRLMAVRTLGGGAGGSSGVGELVLALAALVAEIAAYREATRCLAQARAARQSAGLLEQARPAGPTGRTRPTGPVGDGPQREPRSPASRSTPSPGVAAPGRGNSTPRGRPGRRRRP